MRPRILAAIVGVALLAVAILAIPLGIRLKGDAVGRDAGLVTLVNMLGAGQARIGQPAGAGQMLAQYECWNMVAKEVVQLGVTVARGTQQLPTAVSGGLQRPSARSAVTTQKIGHGFIGV